VVKGRLPTYSFLVMVILWGPIRPRLRNQNSQPSLTARKEDQTRLGLPLYHKTSPQPSRRTGRSGPGIGRNRYSASEARRPRGCEVQAQSRITRRGQCAIAAFVIFQWAGTHPPTFGLYNGHKKPFQEICQLFHSCPERRLDREDRRTFGMWARCPLLRQRIWTSGLTATTRRADTIVIRPPTSACRQEGFPHGRCRIPLASPAHPPRPRLVALR